MSRRKSPRSPVIIAAFEGWNDAGSAATMALEHLQEQWDAKEFERMDPEEYHDFQVNRPYLEQGPNGREIVWPTTTFSAAELPRGKVILVHGVEPSFRWRRYCTEILDLAVANGVRTVITLGALLADVPHTRPIPLTATSDSEGLRSVLPDVEPNNYEGPTGIVGVLQHAAVTRSLQSVSLWAAVPHYVGGPPSPKAALALVTRIEELLEETIDLGSLPDDAATWQREVDEIANEDPEIVEYVTQLEQTRDAADSPDASGDAIAREFEQWLRGQEPGRESGRDLKN